MVLPGAGRFANPQLADRMRISGIRLRHWNGQLPTGAGLKRSGARIMAFSKRE